MSEPSHNGAMGAFADELATTLMFKPRDVLENLRVLASQHDVEAVSRGEVPEVIQLVRAIVTPWATSSRENAELTVEVLGYDKARTKESVLWILGTPFAAWRTVTGLAPLPE